MKPGRQCSSEPAVLNNETKTPLHPQRLPKCSLWPNAVSGGQPGGSPEPPSPLLLSRLRAMSSTSSAIRLFSCQGHWPTFPSSRRISESASASCSSPSPIDFVNHRQYPAPWVHFLFCFLSFPSSFPRPTSHTLEPSLTFPLVLPKLPIFPEANHSHTLEPSLQKTTLCLQN